MKFALGLLFVGTAIGCAAQPGGDVPAACVGKCDGAESALSRGLSRLIVAPQYLELVEQLGERARSAADPRQRAVRRVAEHATSITLEVVSSSTVTFPAGERLDGYIEATLAGDDLGQVSFRAAAPGEVFEPTGELAEGLGLVIADPRYAEALRGRSDGSLRVRRVITEPAEDGQTVVVEVSGVGEIVARIVDEVERPSRVRWLRAWEDGVILHERLATAPSLAPLPGNGYFLFDDRAAFIEKFWRKYAGAGTPEPYVGRDERVLGVAVSYFPYAGKSMKVEAVRDTADATVVDVVVHWDGFGCFELISEIQLIDVIKVPRNGKPVRLVLHRSTGPGCDIGGPPPPAPSRKVDHDLRVSDTPDRFFVCTATGRFDPPFASCAARDSLD